MTTTPAQPMTTEEARNALCSTLECLLELASAAHTGELRLTRRAQGFFASLCEGDRLGELLDFIRLGFSQCAKVYRQLGGPDCGADCTTDDFRARASFCALEAPEHGSTATH
jgi:hypothetical protein